MRRASSSPTISCFSWSHSRYVMFQMTEVGIPRRLFETILRRISRLGPIAPVPT